MAINTQLEAYKLKRLLKRNGVKYEFRRKVNNEFGEPVKDSDIVGSVTGIYHEESSHISIKTGETTQYRTNKVPSILCLYDDVSVLNLHIGDTVAINDKVLKVTGIINVQEWNIIVDISLEVIDNVIHNKV